MASFLISHLHFHPANAALLPPTKPTLPLLGFKRISCKYPIIAFATPPSSSWEQEETRWLREERRWLREEQRWLREESRWQAEREALLQEIAALRLRIQALEGDESAHTPSVAPFLKVLEEADSQMAEIGSGPRPMLLEEAQVKETLVEEVSKSILEEKREATTRRSLRKGSEGDDVRLMQEALQSLGFYSGEEDMEYSNFSNGTERAVKTWQASLGASDDGIMTIDLLQRLYMEVGLVNGGRKLDKEEKRDSIAFPEKDMVNGAPVSSVTEITEIKETVVKGNDTEAKVAEHKVFLLGENRWEEPSRLAGRNKGGTESKPISVNKCLSCRGEGRLMCAECDGTGEPNIEPQFLEWVDEGAKCPYCEGLGYTICDVCEGRTAV